MVSLHTSRSGDNPISFSDILAYVQLYNIQEDMIDDLVECCKIADQLFFEHLAEKRQNGRTADHSGN